MAESIETNDRQMKPKKAPERTFFFPKANPPMSVKAASRAEAEKKLQAKTKRK